MWVYPEVRTLGEVTEYHARHNRSRVALIAEGRRVCFGEFDAVANRVANALIARGVGQADRVSFFGKNSVDFYCALFGTAKTLGCFTPFNWRLSKLELAELIRDSGTRVGIVEREFASAWAEATAAAGVTVDTILIDSTHTLEVEVGDFPSDPPDVFVSEDEGAIQLYTSGTTGRPKGVILSHGGFNRMRLCEHLEPAYEWQEGDSFINPLPNFHLLHIGIAIQCLYNGVSITIVRQFDPAKVLAVIAAERPTLLTLTPTMLQMLLDHPDVAATDFSSLRLTLYAGSPISLGLIKHAVAVMPCRFMQFYGATETGGAASLLRPDEHELSDEQKLQSCGRPLPLIEFRIVDAAGLEQPDGQPGELLIRSPAIMRAYWQQAEATRSCLSNGWYRSGDVARRDAAGLYYIVDRVKDMIVSGGENIYSAEIENVLSTHPGVASVAVIGVPDVRWGEAVKAIVIPRQNQPCTEADLVRYCRERLAAYKVPKSIDFVDSFPIGPTGKVSKKDLRSRYWIGSSRSVA
jgi:acyl-CoA synthetase (AMP-forming)/AMP-acid ligase II